jgi:hypothetical protein
MLCPSVISRFGTLADKQRFDAASAMGQTRSSGDVASMSGLPESGRAVDIPERQVRANSGPDRPSRASASLACIRSQSDIATIKSPTHSGTRAFALSPEKSAGTSNLPVCRSYLQRQPFTTPVCMGLRPLTSASPDRVIRR